MFSAASRQFHAQCLRLSPDTYGLDQIASELQKRHSLRITELSLDVNPEM